MVSGTGSMWTKTTGTAPNRSFVVEWRNVNFYNTALTVDFEAQLERGRHDRHALPQHRRRPA